MIQRLNEIALSCSITNSSSSSIHNSVSCCTCWSLVVSSRKKTMPFSGVSLAEIQRYFALRIKFIPLSIFIRQKAYQLLFHSNKIRLHTTKVITACSLKYYGKQSIPRQISRVRRIKNKTVTKQKTNKKTNLLRLGLYQPQHV